MALSNTQQILEQIKRSQSILIAFKQDWDGDALASALALAKALKKFDRQVTLACQDFVWDKKFDFLPAEQISSQLPALQKFIIRVKAAAGQIGEIRQETGPEHLDLQLAVNHGQLRREDISVSSDNYRYDLIFVVGSPDLEALGKVYEGQPDFFYAKTKINIDCQENNEYFGDLNLIDLSAAATAEIVYRLIKEFDERLIDEDIATCLLTGIIAATKNFKVAKLPPPTLNLASWLIARGANREAIVHNLYQHRSLGDIKLWGRVLAGLKSDLSGQLVWSSIAWSDLKETASSVEGLKDLAEELAIYLPQSQVIVLLAEEALAENNKISATVHSKKINALTLLDKFNPAGNQNIARCIFDNQLLTETEKAVINEIKTRLAGPQLEK